MAITLSSLLTYIHGHSNLFASYAMLIRPKKLKQLSLTAKHSGT